MKAITQQQRLYAERRVSGMNQKEAAIAAGYPEKSAAQAASRNDKNKNVIAYFKRLGFEPTTRLSNTPDGKKKTKTRKAAQEIIADIIGEAETSGDLDKLSGGELGLTYLESLVRKRSEDPKLRADCAKYLAKHSLEVKKNKPSADKKADDAKDAAKRFGTSAPPPTSRTIN